MSGVGWVERMRDPPRPREGLVGLAGARPTLHQLTLPARRREGTADESRAAEPAAAPPTALVRPRLFSGAARPGGRRRPLLAAGPRPGVRRHRAAAAAAPRRRPAAPPGAGAGQLADADGPGRRPPQCRAGRGRPTAAAVLH